MSRRTEDFAERVRHDLYSEAPTPLLSLVSSDLALMGQFQGYCDDVREGLVGVEEGCVLVPALEVKLSARRRALLEELRKAAIRSAVDSPHYTCERLISRLSVRVLDFALELGAPLGLGEP